jgi:serine/threonine protein phosphatase PrpC
MRLIYYQFTNKGGRELNEDAVSCFIDEKQETGIFILADGLGGHGHGEVASELVARTMIDKFKSADIIDAGEAHEILKSANDLLLETKAQNPQYRRMKSTAAVLYIRENNILCAHIGDSRLYHFYGGAVKFITADHSVSYKKYVQREIKYDDISLDEDRSLVLRVMGNEDKFEPEISVLSQPLETGGAFLMCTDGFWEYVKKDEMLVDLLKSESPKEWTEYMLLRHIARIDGENDNFSSIAVFAD